MKREENNIMRVLPEEEMDSPDTDSFNEHSDGQDRNDLEAELSEQAEKWPKEEDCSTDNIPDGAEPAPPCNELGENRTKTRKNSSGKLFVPDVTSMTKYLCGNHRLIVYSYLNQCLKDGSLSRITGILLRDTWLNRKSCELTEFSYWKIDRTSFYTDVLVTLHLSTGKGIVTWKGTVTIWCSFEEVENNTKEDKYDIDTGLPDDGFIYVIENLVANVPDRSDYVRLSPFLVPYYKNAQVDGLAESIWEKYFPEALHDPEKRDAAVLAKKMGLTIWYLPVHRHKGINSILFFKSDTIEVLEEGARPGSFPENIRIPARTIVINTNAIRQKYSSFDIFHECIHSEEHYLFYCLQKLSCNDVTRVPVMEIDPEEDPDEEVESDGSDGAAIKEPKQESEKKKALKDPIYFMEKQANRGASALMMPAEDTRRLIFEETIRAQETIRRSMGRPSRHMGELYEEVGKQMSKKLGLPHFRVRARLIQLGYVEAKGSLNYVEKKLIQPFAFDLESWQEATHTFVIDRRTLTNLMIGNEDFRKVMESSRYVYADGHVVRNGSRFLEVKKDRNGVENLVLTDWANRHVDECCLRFVRVYMQEGIGRYVFGRMYYDAEFVARTRFYIDDFLNREKIGDIDDIEARMLYRQRFPKKFGDAFQFLRVANGIRMVDMADQLGLSEQQLRRWLDMPSKYRNEDFLTSVALILELPDWISRLLFKRAGLILDDEDARHVALDHILRVQSCDGIQSANSYLERHGMRTLTY